MTIAAPILFATESHFAHLTADDLVAAAAIERLGVPVEPLVWDTADDERITASAGIVIRSCWDYHMKPRAFEGWLARVTRLGVPLVNDAALVRWNLHKSYLLDLEERGAHVIPTRLVRSVAPLPLAQILAETGWQEAVVKPAVSLNGYETWRVAAGNGGDAPDRFARLVARGDVLVQKFMPEIATAGEWSLIFLGGEFSHAVSKLPAPGEFRVQLEHGGSLVAATPPAQIVEAAAAAVALLPVPPTYVRVDGVFAGSFMIMEMECIDPVLHFEDRPAAAEHFARLVVDAVARRGAPAL